MTLLAHGGTAGAVVEIAGVVVLAGLLLAVWLRDRRQPDDADDSRSREEA